MSRRPARRRARTRVGLIIELTLATLTSTRTLKPFLSLLIFPFSRSPLHGSSKSQLPLLQGGRRQQGFFVRAGEECVRVLRFQRRRLGQHKQVSASVLAKVEGGVVKAAKKDPPPLAPKLCTSVTDRRVRARIASLVRENARPTPPATATATPAHSRWRQMRAIRVEEGLRRSARLRLALQSSRRETVWRL